MQKRIQPPSEDVIAGGNGQFVRCSMPRWEGWKADGDLSGACSLRLEPEQWIDLTRGLRAQLARKILRLGASWRLPLDHPRPVALMLLPSAVGSARGSVLPPLQPGRKVGVEAVA